MRHNYRVPTCADTPLTSSPSRDGAATRVPRGRLDILLDEPLGLDVRHSLAEGQLELEVGEEHRDYLSRQLLTYIGNKRSLLSPIRNALETVRQKTGHDKLRILDAFSGSGVVSRLFKQYASELIVNDIEDYARAVSECYLTNRSTISARLLETKAADLNGAVDRHQESSGFFRRLYAPRDPDSINRDDRVFYTPANAARIDTYRQLLAAEPPEVQRLLMGPLLSSASVHANTAGVFKGFYKDKATGIGKFGGTGANALDRILGRIELEPPVLSNFDCDYAVHQVDANQLVHTIGDLDVAYFDPPYNQHPYGSNYFMLNLLLNYEEPVDISKVSGIPKHWRRSAYNVRSKSLQALRDLVTAVDATFIILSFNDEGFIPPSEVLALLTQLGPVSEHKQSYTTFRGCRNLGNRSHQVTEHVYLVEKG